MAARTPIESFAAIGPIHHRRSVRRLAQSRFNPCVERLEDRLLLATLTVTNTADSSAGSLRQAILDSNASIGVADTIEFNIPGPGPHSILVGSGGGGALPAITDLVVINGYTQGTGTPGDATDDAVANSNTVESQLGLNTVLKIELVGTSAGAGAHGLRLGAGSDGSTIRGLAIDRFAGDGIRVESAGNVIAGNFVGTNVAGTSAGANAHGIHVFGASNTIGGTAAADCNLASGNTGTGVFIDGGSSNVVQGNLVGLNAAGATRLANAEDGVAIVNASGNTVGGADAGAGNVISGNTIDGILILSFGANPAASNVVQGNRIGTDVTGTQELGNLRHGIFTIKATNTTIGGSAAGAGNLISGNFAFGILISDNSTSAVIQGNRIGTDAAGTAAIGNIFNGVQVESTGAVIGGTATGAGNVISGNFGAGLAFVPGGSNGLVQGNRIGTTAGGDQPLGNDGMGVEISGGGTQAPANNTIGGTTAGAGNTIAFNRTGLGVSINCVGHSILGNAIFSNTFGGGIGLFQTLASGTDPFDADTGANRLQNFPILDSATDSSGGTRITGTLTSAANSTYRLEFFASAEADASGRGEGQTFLGSIDLMTDATGVQPFTADVASAPAGQLFITATATDLTIRAPATIPAGDTSEFSPWISIPVTDIVVTTTADSGAGSLRDALDDANVLPGTQTITFGIPATDPGHVYYHDDGIAGSVTLTNVMATTAADDTTIADIDPDWPHSWFSIRPVTPLPTITSPVIIDGSTQPGAVVNSNPVDQGLGLNSVLRIEVSGASGADLFPALMQFTPGSEDSLLRDLVLNRATSPFGFVPAVAVAADGVGLFGNYIGTDVSGSLNLGDFVVVGSSNSVIGGTTADARNLIPSILIDSNIPANLQNRIEGNLIGVDRTGTRGIGGGVTDRGTDTVIGGNDPLAQNIISAIALEGTRALLQNNLIGSDVTGTIDSGGDGFGVAVTGNDNRILQNTVAFHGHVQNAGTIDEFTVGGGIFVTGSQNQIAQNAIFSNTGPGITVGAVFGPASNRNLISQNSIYSNSGIGIDLVKAGDNVTGGVTPNDVPPDSVPPDQDTGPNLLQNFPSLTAVTDLNPGTRIEGTFASTPNANFRLEFYANAERDEAGGGLVAEGQTFIGTIDVTTDAAGLAGFAVDLPGLPGGQPFVTATATDITDDGTGPRNNTSEFSPTLPLGGVGFVVTSTADTGLGTLREAITVGNLTPGPQTITFNIPATDPRHFYYRDDGVAGEVTFENTTVTAASDDALIGDIDPDWTHSWFGIILDRELQDITDTITIDGYSQPGATRNTLPFPQGIDTVLRIELDGRNVAGDGLTLSATADSEGNISDAGGSVIRGLAVNAFGGHGIVARTLGGGNTIAGSLIGTDISGAVSRGNLANGIQIDREVGGRVGGPAASDRNLISANRRFGLEFVVSGDFLVEGNLFGSDARLTVALGNGDVAIHVDIGDPNAGVARTSMRSDSNTVPEDSTTFRNNLIATGPEGGIFGFGLGVLQSDKTGPISRDDFGAAFGASLTGRLLGSPGSRAQSSSTNEFLAIDLGGDGVTPNDACDLDEGPNNLQNFPVLASATTTTETSIVGTLNSLATTRFRIEFYSNTVGTEFRAGERSLGTIDVTTDANCNASFTFPSPIVVPSGQFITSTATRLADLDSDPATPLDLVETSEFSAGIVVQGEAATSVTATNVDSLVVDSDGDGRADAGDTNRYTVLLTNTGAQDAESVHYVEDLEPNTALVDGSVSTTQGTFASGNYNLAVNVGMIPAASSVTITFDVVVKDPLPAGVTAVSNQGVVSGSNFAASVTDDPNSPEVGDPTITPAGTPADTVGPTIIDIRPVVGQVANLLLLSRASGRSGSLPDGSLPNWVLRQFQVERAGGTAQTMELDIVFSEPIKPEQAEIEANYSIIGPPKGRRPGATIAIVSAALDAATNTVRLTTDRALKLSKPVQVTISNMIGDFAGNPLGGGPGDPGEDYVARLSVGTTATFTEPDGDKATLALARGGTLRYIERTDGSQRDLHLIGTVAGRSTLAGSVKRPKTGGSDGLAMLTRLTVEPGQQFRSTLTNPPFRIGPLSQSAIDELLAASGGTLAGVLFTA
jgi:uncharacterized repeat protein (TIGR01451 family)